MIISRLIIKKFGKFNNKEIELKPGINLIYGDNEAGKSTIHKFIEGILYGFFKPYVKRKTYTSDYEKYKPWNGEGYEGAIIVKYQDKSYWINRKFNKHDEEVIVLDNLTGEDVSHQCKYDKKIKLISPTSSIWNISLNIYNNVLSIGQLKIKPEESDNEIRDSLSKINNKSSSDISIQKAINNLTQQKDDIGTSTRSKSEYGKLASRLQDLIKEKKVAIQTREELKTDYNLLSNLKEENKEVENELKLVNEKLKILDNSTLNKDIYKLQSLKDDISTLKLKLTDYKYFEKLTLEDLDDALKLYKEHEELTKEMNDIEEYVKKNNAQNFNINKNKKSIFIILIAFIEIILLLSSIFINPVLTVGFIVNTFFLIYLIRSNKRGIENGNNIHFNKDRLSIIREMLDSIDEKRTGLKIWIENEEEYMAQRNSIIEYTFITKSLDDKIKEYNFLNSSKEVAATSEGNIDQLRDKNQLLLNKRLDMEKSISRLEERINLYVQSTRSIQDITEEITLIEEKLLNYDNDIKAINLTIDILDKVAKEQQRDYSNDLNKFLSDNISYVTAAKYEDIKVDENFQVSVIDKNNKKLVKVDELSEGTKDQMYIALRIAVANVLGQNYPLIFDDSFIQYDDNRLERTLKFISNHCRDRQIIIMSCQQREKLIFDKLNVEYTYIEL